MDESPGTATLSLKKKKEVNVPSEECMICLMEFEQEDQVVILPCGTGFQTPNCGGQLTNREQIQDDDQPADIENANSIAVQPNESQNIQEQASEPHIATTKPTHQGGPLTERNLVMQDDSRSKIDQPGDQGSVLPVQTPEMQTRHIYHYDCIKLWVSKRDVCPLCTKNLSELISEQNGSANPQGSSTARQAQNQSSSRDANVQQNQQI